jgi:serine/threonine protein kinase
VGSPGFQRGDKIDRFIVLEIIGQGGMGTVVSVYHPDLDRRVAIKVLRSNLVHGPHPTLLRRLRVVAAITQPPVIKKILDMGLTGEPASLLRARDPLSSASLFD